MYLVLSTMAGHISRHHSQDCVYIFSEAHQLNKADTSEGATPWNLPDGQSLSWAKQTAGRLHNLIRVTTQSLISKSRPTWCELLVRRTNGYHGIDAHANATPDIDVHLNEASHSQGDGSTVIEVADTSPTLEDAPIATGGDAPPQDNVHKKPYRDLVADPKKLKTGPVRFRVRIVP